MEIILLILLHISLTLSNKGDEPLAFFPMDSCSGTNEVMHNLDVMAPDGGVPTAVDFNDHVDNALAFDGSGDQIFSVEASDDIDAKYVIIMLHLPYSFIYN